jgi:UDP-2,4-diacetamido-2,4,6-trideoxy-beta-L-altropyranose hydrolase
MSNIAFRLDADSIIGTGHLMRCLTIANELSNRKYNCHFFLTKLTQPLNNLLVRHGHIVYTQEDEKVIITSIDNLCPELIIIDHYGLDARYESKVRDSCKYILVIDDLADRSHECDYLLDQGPLRTTEDYQPWVTKECKLFLGTKFALIRSEFRKHRKTHCSGWKKGLICFGGSDPSNTTLQVLKALDDINQMEKIKWTVLAGIANPHWKVLSHFAKQSSLDISLIKQSDKIAELMAKHDFAIGAAGGMTWERACIGLPSLIIPIAYNQRFGMQEIKHFDLGETIESSKIYPNSLEIALNELKHKASNYLKRNQSMVDGLGAERLISKISVNL